MAKRDFLHLSLCLAFTFSVYGYLDLKQPGVDLTLTPLEQVSLRLSDYVVGDDLHFSVVTNNCTDGSILLSNLTKITQQSINVTIQSNSTRKPVSNVPLPSFRVHGSDCFVSFDETRVKLFEEKKETVRLAWSEKLLEAVEGVTVMNNEEGTFLFVVTTERQNVKVYIWNVDLPDVSQVAVYSGSELINLKYLKFRSSTLISPPVLAISGTKDSQDLICLYSFNVSTGLLTLGRMIHEYYSVPGYPSGLNMSLLDFQLGSTLITLDRNAGIVSISEFFDYYSETYIGTYPGAGELLFLSNIDSITEMVIIWTSTGAIQVSSADLTLRSYFPMLSSDPETSTIYLDERMLLVVECSGIRNTLSVIEFQEDGLAVVKVSVVVNSSNLEGVSQFASWFDITHFSYVIIQDGDFTLEKTSVVIRSPILTFSNTEQSCSAVVTATSGTSGEQAYIHFSVHSLALNDYNVYYGSGYDLSATRPNPIVYDQSFISNTASMNLSLANLFSGPGLEYQLLSNSTSPRNISSVNVSLAQRYRLDASTYNFSGYNGVPELGCEVASEPLTFLSFTQNYVVLTLFHSHLTKIVMQTYELGLVPRKCRSRNHQVWVYANSTSGVYQISSFAIVLNPLSITRTGYLTISTPCDIFKLNSKFLLCANRWEILVQDLTLHMTGMITADRLMYTHKPWSLSDIELLGDTSHLVAIADESNGVNVMDLKPAVETNGRLIYAERLLSRSQKNTALLYSTERLVVINGEYLFTVYSLIDLKLHFLRALPPFYGPTVHSSALINGFLYLAQNTHISVYDIDSSLHNSLYASIALWPNAQVLVFPKGKTDILLELTIWDSQNYDFNSYELTRYSSKDLICSISCFNCLSQHPEADLILNLTVVAINDFGGRSASRDLQVIFRNQGNFPGFAADRFPIANVTMASDNASQVEMAEAFEGNDLTYRMSVNGLWNYSGRPAPLLLTQSYAHQFWLNLNYTNCSQLTALPTASQVFYLCGNAILVISLPSDGASGNDTFRSTINLSSVQDSISCFTLNLAGFVSPRAFLLLSCMWEQTVQGVLLVKSAFLVVIYNTETQDTESIDSWETVSLCDFVRTVNVSETEVGIYCAAELVSAKIVFSVDVYIAEWSGYTVTSLTHTTLLSPFSIDLPVVLIHDFALCPFSDSYLLFIVDDLYGVSMLQPIATEYRALAQIQNSEIRDRGGISYFTNVLVCNNRLFLITVDHVLVYVIHADNLSWEQTIYPYNRHSTVTYTPGTAFCYQGGNSRFLALVANDDLTSYIRIIDFLSAGDSHVLADITGNIGTGVFASANWLVYNDEFYGNVHGLTITPPTVTVLNFTVAEFWNLTQNWGTNSFTVQVEARNDQGAVMSPNVTIRRMLFHRLVSEERSGSMSWWMLLLFLLFLLLLSLFAVVVLKKQPKVTHPTLSDPHENYIQLRTIPGTESP